MDTDNEDDKINKSSVENQNVSSDENTNQSSSANAGTTAKSNELVDHNGAITEKIIECNVNNNGIKETSKEENKISHKSNSISNSESCKRKLDESDDQAAKISRTFSTNDAFNDDRTKTMTTSNDSSLNISSKINTSEPVENKFVEEKKSNSTNGNDDEIKTSTNGNPPIHSNDSIQQKLPEVWNLISDSEDFKENSEQPKSGDKTAEDEQLFNNFFEELVKLNNKKPIKPYIKSILYLSGYDDLSFFCESFDMEEIKNFVKDNMWETIMKEIKYHKLFYKHPDKFDFIPADKSLLNNLYKKAKEKFGKEKKIAEESEMDDLNGGTLANNINDKPSRKPLDENRLPAMACPGSTLGALIEKKCYVDKTKKVMRLLNNPGHYVFTRPRRFGKSIFLDTVNYACNGDQELFKEYDIGKKENGYKWKKYPVIKLDFCMIFKDSDLNLCEKRFTERLDEIAGEMNIPLRHGVEFASTFRNLVVALHSEYKSQVVVLVDEYDYLLTHTNYEDIKKMKDDKNPNVFKFLKDFFDTTKNLRQSHIHLVLCTGVVRSSYNDILSGGNDDICLDYEDDYGEMIGFTIEEIKHVFGFCIKEWFENKENLKLAKIESEDGIYDKLKKNYNGYSFDRHAKQNIYNPWSITQSLYFKNFKAYWMKSGPPKILMNKVLDCPEALPPSLDLSKSYTLEKLSSDYYETTDLNIILFSLGYLTLIKQENIKYNNDGDILYNINYPNEEVKKAYNRFLLIQNYGEKVTDEIELKRDSIIEELKKINLVSLIEFINKFLPVALASSATLKRADDEPYELSYNSHIYSLAQGLLDNCVIQKSVDGKKSDFLMNVDEDAEIVFIFEMKVLDDNKKYRQETFEERKIRSMKLADEALIQIKDNKYYESYKLKKRLQIVGMVLSHKKIAAIKYGHKISYTDNKLLFDDFREEFFEDNVVFNNMNLEKKKKQTIKKRRN